MSIFKHNPPADVKQATPAPAAGTAVQEAPSDKTRKLAPPFMPPAAATRAAAGVVPPPTTPMYSMHPADAPPLADLEDPETVMMESLKSAKAAAQARAIQRRSAPPATTTIAHLPQHPFDPVAATQAGMLNLAWRWQEAGAPIRAIHTYVELLMRYPHTPGADAAVADLVELSNILTEQGQFHTALAIYDHLEALLA